MLFCSKLPQCTRFWIFLNLNSILQIAYLRHCRLKNMERYAQIADARVETHKHARREMHQRSTKGCNFGVSVPFIVR